MLRAKWRESVGIVDRKIEEYCISKSNLPSQASQAIEKYTLENVHGAGMLIGKMEASFIGFLLRSIKAKRVLELGTFTGYSALIMAENIPQDGEVITIDINGETTSLAKSFWEKSLHGKKIKSYLGNALEVMRNLDGTFDFIFIDADKRNYKSYLENSLELLSAGGVIVVDNTLWGGKVLPGAALDLETHYDRNTEFIQALNDFVADSPAIYGTLLPIRDGMFLIQKKGDE